MKLHCFLFGHDAVPQFTDNVIQLACHSCGWTSKGIRTGIATPRTTQAGDPHRQALHSIRQQLARWKQRYA